MGKRFIFFYLMKKEPDRIKAIVPHHVEYWHARQLAEYTGGPFADRSGGLVTFEADSVERATEIVNKDPFVTEGLLETRWLKEWIIENIEARNHLTFPHFSMVRTIE